MSRRHISRQVAIVALGLMTTVCGSGNERPALGPSTLPTSFQVTGYVDDTSFRPVAGTTIEVIDGPQAGTSTSTDANGAFSLNALVGTRLRATKDGYQPAIQVFQAPPNPVMFRAGGPMTFFLSTARASTSRATLTVDADPACTDLPRDVRSRTYTATVTGNSYSPHPNSTFFVNLDGTSLDGYFRFVFLEVADGTVTFDLSDNGIEEEVAPETYLFVGGVGSTQTPPGAATISAPLTTGMIDYCVVKSDPGQAYPCTDQAIVRTKCTSPNNRLTLKWQ